METIRVKAVREDGRVAFFERADDHPDGEVFIVCDGNAVEAGETRALKDAIRAGRLVETTETAVSRQQTPATETRQAANVEFLQAADYDSMTVAEAQAYIESLSETEREIALVYEKRNKNRPTLLKEFEAG